MKKIRAFWYILKRSLLDPLYYRELLQSPFGFSYKYLLMLLAILVFINLIPPVRNFLMNRSRIPTALQEVRNTVHSLYPDELELRISNGKLYTNVEEPYAIPVPQEWGDLGKQNLVLIDTGATVEDYPDTDAFILATRNALVYPDRGSDPDNLSTRVFYLREITRSVYLDKDRYVDILVQLDPYIQKAPVAIDWVVLIGVGIIPWFGALLWSVGVLIGLLINTLLLHIIARILHMQITYAQMFRLGMHGATWSLLTQAILAVTKQDMPHASSVVFFLWMGVILISLRQYKTSITT